MEVPLSSTTSLASTLTRYQRELNSEMAAILDYWMRRTPDQVNGGFHGSIDHLDRVIADAPRGIVMYSRIAWAFSAGYKHSGIQLHLLTAKRAVDYIIRHFHDRENGGVFWSVRGNGEALDGRKQIYGLAFCIYGLTEYYSASHDEDALQFSKELFYLIEKYSFDKEAGGYLEAFAQDWSPVSDLRLSEKDDNASKTMNTHLHIVEAYASLYKVWPDNFLREKISSILDLFNTRFINTETYQFHLFFDSKWRSTSGLISYGHDIEAAWLLLQCAEAVDLQEQAGIFRKLAVQVTDAAITGLDGDGGMWYELEADKGLIREKHWWPQSEAMIGFFNAYQLTGDYSYLQHSINAWNFTKEHIIDKVYGEWHWGINHDYSIIRKDKAGFWKCPYHNTRACLEIIQRIKLITHDTQEA